MVPTARITRFEVRFIPVTDDFRLDLSDIETLMVGCDSSRSPPCPTCSALSIQSRNLPASPTAHGALIAVDAAQAVGHGPSDVAAEDVDFYIFSAHKMLGPTGLGIFWTRDEILASMPPFLGGGGMIADVATSGYVAAKGPARFEAGTPPIGEAAGLGAAVTYLEGLGMENIARYEKTLTIDALARLEEEFIGRVRVIGPHNALERGGVISLDVEGVHAHDVAQVLDQYGVCVRPGHHCAKPLMKRFKLSATARASFGPYSLVSDTDVLLEALSDALKLFG